DELARRSEVVNGAGRAGVTGALDRDAHVERTARPRRGREADGAHDGVRAGAEVLDVAAGREAGRVRAEHRPTGGARLSHGLRGAGEARARVRGEGEGEDDGDDDGVRGQRERG